jgi:hypothetical protein
MTKIFTDSVTTLAEANLNKLGAGDGSTSYQLASWGLRIRYTGAVWEAVALEGATAQIPLVALVWTGASNRLEISTAACTNLFVAGQIPLAFVDPLEDTTGAASTFYEPRAIVISNTLTYVRFYDHGGATLQTVQGTNMNFRILWHGRIS